MAWLLGVAIVLGIGAVGIRLYMSREAENHLAADEIVDIAHLQTTSRGNAFLMCPPGYCAATPDAESPVFPMRWERLRDYWREAIDAQPRIERVAYDAARRRIVYIQRSALLRFPDIVTVEFVPLDDQRSSLAVYSRSRYGREDFGVNRSRVTRWTGLLENMARSDSHTVAGAGLTR